MFICADANELLNPYTQSRTAENCIEVLGICSLVTADDQVGLDTILARLRLEIAAIAAS